MERYIRFFEEDSDIIKTLMKESSSKEIFPSENLEKILNIKGLSQKYKLPDGKNEHHWGEILSTRKINIINNFYKKILLLNDCLNDIKIKRKETQASFGDKWYIINGVLSRIKCDDIQYFIDEEKIQSKILKIFDYIQNQYGVYVTYAPNKKDQQLILSKFKLSEDLHLSDFTKHSGASDFTRDWVEIRRKIVGAGNKSSKLHSIKVNRKKDYVTFVFKSLPSYKDASVEIVDPVSLNFSSKKARAYTEEIRILNFFKMAETKPGFKQSEMTWKEIKEIINVASIQTFCNCGSFQFQGMNYVSTMFDASVYPEYRAPKRWDKLHHDDNFVCKHTSSIFNSMQFWINPMSSMVNKYLKQVNAGK